MKTAKTGVKLLKYMVNVAACVRLLTNTARNGVKLLKLKGKSLMRYWLHRQLYCSMISMS